MPSRTSAFLQLAIGIVTAGAVGGAGWRGTGELVPEREAGALDLDDGFFDFSSSLSSLSSLHTPLLQTRSPLQSESFEQPAPLSEQATTTKPNTPVATIDAKTPARDGPIRGSLARHDSFRSALKPA